MNRDESAGQTVGEGPTGASREGGRTLPVPAWAPLVTTLAVALLGGWLGGTAGVALVVLAALSVAAMLAVAWPRTPGLLRLGQSAVLLLVGAIVAVLLSR